MGERDLALEFLTQVAGEIAEAGPPAGVSSFGFAIEVLGVGPLDMSGVYEGWLMTPAVRRDEYVTEAIAEWARDGVFPSKRVYAERVIAELQRRGIEAFKEPGSFTLDVPGKMSIVLTNTFLAWCQAGADEMALAPILDHLCTATAAVDWEPRTWDDVTEHGFIDVLRTEKADAIMMPDSISEMTEVQPGYIRIGERIVARAALIYNGTIRQGGTQLLRFDRTLADFVAAVVDDTVYLAHDEHKTMLWGVGGDRDIQTVFRFVDDTLRGLWTADLRAERVLLFAWARDDIRMVDIGNLELVRRLLGEVEAKATHGVALGRAPLVWDDDWGLIEWTPDDGHELYGRVVRLQVLDEIERWSMLTDALRQGGYQQRIAPLAACRDLGMEKPATFSVWPVGGGAMPMSDWVVIPLGGEEFVVVYSSDLDELGATREAADNHLLTTFLNAGPFDLTLGGAVRAVGDRVARGQLAGALGRVGCVLDDLT